MHIQAFVNKVCLLTQQSVFNPRLPLEFTEVTLLANSDTKGSRYVSS